MDIPVEVLVTQDELDQLRFTQIRGRSDWPAVFSCNYYHEIWVFVTYGYTKEEARALPFSPPLLDLIVNVYLDVRSIGGRFFVDSRGVFFHEEGGPLVQFISWVHDSVRTPADILGSLSAIFRKGLGSELRCLLVRGSVWRGDVIPHFSDLNLVVFTKRPSSEVQSSEQMRVVEERLQSFQLQDYGLSRIQVSIEQQNAVRKLTPATKAYTVLAGTVPESLARTAEHVAYVNHAKDSLSRIGMEIRRFEEAFRTRSNVALARRISRAVRQALWSIVVANGMNPAEVAGAKLPFLIRWASDVGIDGKAVSTLFERARWRRIPPGSNDVKDFNLQGLLILDEAQRVAQDLGIHIAASPPADETNQVISLAESLSWGISRDRSYPWTD